MGNWKRINVDSDQILKRGLEPKKSISQTKLPPYSASLSKPSWGIQSTMTNQRQLCDRVDFVSLSWNVSAGCEQDMCDQCIGMWRERPKYIMSSAPPPTIYLSSPNNFGLNFLLNQSIFTWNNGYAERPPSLGGGGGGVHGADKVSRCWPVSMHESASDW